MRIHFVQMTLLGALLVTCAGAQAQAAGPPEPAAVAATTATRSGDSAPQPEQARPVAGWGVPAQQGKLAASRGGTDTVSNDARLGATVSNNTATNVATGSNIIDNGSFANMTGLPMVIQNSGANVLIQNATVINLQLK